MRSFWTYLRQHPWQRRAMTVMLAGALGVTAAAFFLPTFQQYTSDRRLISQLSSPDSKQRLIATYRAQKLSRENPTTLRRLQEALDTPDDRLFTTLVNVLRGVGDTHAVTTPPERIDRLLAIEMETTRSPESRRLIFMPALLADRDNQYVRRALSAAASDKTPEIRSLAATLAAKVGDDATLSKLLADADSNVSARAALDAGLGGRKSLAGQVEKLLQSNSKDICSSAAFAVATLDAEKYSSAIFSRLEQLDEPDLRARLLHVIAAAGTQAAADALTKVVASADNAGRLLTPAELIACRKLGITQAQDQVRKILTLAAKRDPAITVPQALAAVDAAAAFKMPVRAELSEICQNLWTPDAGFVLLLSHAAGALGEQANMPQGDRPDKPTPAECVRQLQAMARYSVEVSTVPATASSPTSESTVELTTPLPSAAAAVALWELQTQLSDEFVREACVDEKLVVGDYVSWNLAQSPQAARAFKLGEAMLPPMDSKTKVYSANERSAGAMLLALSARSADQVQIAKGRLLERIASEELDPPAKGSYRCGALILGERGLLEDVRTLLEMGFPQRRVLTALWCAGDSGALDWLLWNPQLGPKEISDALVLRGCEQVLRATAPALPEVDSIDPTGQDDLQLWEIQILRDDYVIHRSSVKPTRPTPTTQKN